MFAAIDGKDLLIGDSADHLKRCEGGGLGTEALACINFQSLEHGLERIQFSHFYSMGTDGARTGFEGSQSFCIALPHN